jgi:hypothetical protein
MKIRRSKVLNYTSDGSKCLNVVLSVSQCLCGRSLVIDLLKNDNLNICSQCRYTTYRPKKKELKKSEIGFIPKKE